ncbi:lactoylglutathione lyase [Halogranum rubrum]|uniref:Lactoylglutathione lyase n=1 Tax=Halogranum rubrum TaxID=553466 RepID=A0A1I4FAQ0_9EURY|nr:VOC family protein [Halogranum rubrum]SFL14954.1 lactoylglutathione lyase [Halogranum rubrum]
MDAEAIDHVNLRIPADGVDRAREFYVDALDFSLEGLDTYPDEKPFFSVRLADGCVLHLWPDEEFVEPTRRENYDHVAIRVRESLDEVKARLDAHDVEIAGELEPLGATGVAPAVYVHDPFGYRVELKTSG